jgi:hypothetical protein
MRIVLFKVQSMMHADANNQQEYLVLADASIWILKALILNHGDTNLNPQKTIKDYS